MFLKPLDKTVEKSDSQKAEESLIIQDAIWDDEIIPMIRAGISASSIKEMLEYDLSRNTKTVGTVDYANINRLAMFYDDLETRLPSELFPNGIPDGIVVRFINPLIALGKSSDEIVQAITDVFCTQNRKTISGIAKNTIEQLWRKYSPLGNHENALSLTVDADPVIPPQ